MGGVFTKPGELRVAPPRWCGQGSPAPVLGSSVLPHGRLIIRGTQPTNFTRQIVPPPLNSVRRKSIPAADLESYSVGDPDKALLLFEDLLLCHVPETKQG